MAYFRRVASVSFVGLFLTGLWLFFFYTPTSGFGFQNRVMAQMSVMVTLHWLFTISFVVSLFALTVFYARQKQFTALMFLIGTVVLSLGAATLGPLLAWKQLGFYSVTTGSNVDGFELFFTDQIKFAIVGGPGVGSSGIADDGYMVEPSTLTILLVIHVAIWLLLGGSASAAHRLTASRS